MLRRLMLVDYIIEGRKKLEGEVIISGSKNASLPILAASILNGKRTALYNVPNIHDTQITKKIMELLGCKVVKKGNKIIVDSSHMSGTIIPEELMSQMRSSVILAGAIIGRFKKAVFSCPGGCDIGARPIDLHLDGFRKLGIDIEEDGGCIKCKCDKICRHRYKFRFSFSRRHRKYHDGSSICRGRNGYNKRSIRAGSGRFRQIFK